ncbi:DUF4253 domain-containing protein [Pyxidicoccus xibeiensis]|uniref:DUF4253 domain-containing protein n=1 Tax=Pyxidicoccus xibeiensis TaxID=2906759 RepID=UPI0020A7F845|nr:DUF4253 domain-containing protein [Pyxidicoccus xibeiensis]MCP3138361.1 DUF4253 domain-containing protein [Pyxidicoccus xibeiensis]
MSTQGSKTSGSPPEAPRYPQGVEAAIEAALILAALGPAQGSDEELLARHRLAVPYNELALLRRYTLGGEGPEAISTWEAEWMLELTYFAPGDPVELIVDVARLPHLLVRLADPEARVLSRAAAVVGVDEAELRTALRRSGLDLEARTLKRHPWTRMPIARDRSWTSVKVVETVKDPRLQLSLREARLLDPSLTVGAEVEMPDTEEALSDILEDLPPQALRPRFYQPSLDVERFEGLRGIVPEVPTPEPLKGLDLGPLHALYPEGYGVLYADVPGEKAERLWRTLDAQASRTGYRPVLLGGDEGKLREAHLAWSEERKNRPKLPRPDNHIGLPMWADPVEDPPSNVALAERVDVEALIAKARAAPRSDMGEDEDEAQGVRTSLGAVVEPLSRKPYGRVRIALVPTDAAWKTVAFLPILLQAGESTPSLVKVTAMARRWEERYGARVASVTPGTVEWVVDRLPKDRDAALALAYEHLALVPSNLGTAEQEAAALLESTTWHLWWD